MTQMRRGAIEYCVLALLRRREWYGFELAFRDTVDRLLIEGT
jgi:PadR family transcriptional regulator PadR